MRSPPRDKDIPTPITLGNQAKPTGNAEAAYWKHLVRAEPELSAFRMQSGRYEGGSGRAMAGKLVPKMQHELAEWQESLGGKMKGAHQAGTRF